MSTTLLGLLKPEIFVVVLRISPSLPAPELLVSQRNAKARGRSFLYELAAQKCNRGSALADLSANALRMLTLPVPAPLTSQSSVKSLTPTTLKRPAVNMVKCSELFMF